MAPLAICSPLSNENRGSGEVHLDTKPDHLESTQVPAETHSLVHETLRQRISQINTDLCEPGEEDAFFVADLGHVYRQQVRWKQNLARVKPFYAVKCNPDLEVLRLLASLGTGFDCASKAEIDLVLGLGVEPDRIIYAQPCKTKSYLRHARSVGVKRMTFDNADELYKIKEQFPEAEVILRILTDDSASLCRLSVKFGADLYTGQALIYLARELGIKLVGVSFHVGSGASDPSAFQIAVADARVMFNVATTAGFDLQILDIGGGFTDETFESFAAKIDNALDEHFPGTSVKVIAEPGRYYTASAFTLAANILARREIIDEHGQTSYMLYLNDGVYGNFSNIIFDHQRPVAKVLCCRSGVKNDQLTRCSIWGPTCDGIDVITSQCYLPGKLDIGDWLYFENMGAYTKCSATRFNGFTDKHEVIYVSSEVGAGALLGY